MVKIYRKRVGQICTNSRCKKIVKASGLCNNHYMEKWRKENPGRDALHATNYRKRVGQKTINARNRISRNKNKDAINKKQRGKYAVNQISITSERRKKYASDKEYREKLKRQSRRSALKHKPRVLAKKKKTHQELRERVLRYYSNGSPICNECGISEIPFLSIDHIHGRKQMNTDWSTGKLYRYLDTKHPSGYQVLCHNCNMLKEMRRKKRLHLQTPMAVKRRRQRKDTKKMVLQAYSTLSIKCQCCGYSDLNALGLDHIHGRKNMKFAEDLSSDDLYMRIKKEYKKTGNWPEGFQTFCSNCNLAKRDFLKCPHQK